MTQPTLPILKPETVEVSGAQLESKLAELSVSQAVRKCSIIKLEAECAASRKTLASCAG